VIQPHEVQGFLTGLPVGRIPGVGEVTEARMKRVGISTVVIFRLTIWQDWKRTLGDMADAWTSLPAVSTTVPFVPNRVSKSISAEDTFERDIPLVDTERLIRKLAETRNSAR
jgi:DNA polymerase-4